MYRYFFIFIFFYYNNFSKYNNNLLENKDSIVFNIEKAVDLIEFFNIRFPGSFGITAIKEELIKFGFSHDEILFFNHNDLILLYLEHSILYVLSRFMTEELVKSSFSMTHIDDVSFMNVFNKYLLQYDSKLSVFLESILREKIMNYIYNKRNGKKNDDLLQSAFFFLQEYSKVFLGYKLK